MRCISIVGSLYYRIFSAFIIIIIIITYSWAGEETNFLHDLHTQTRAPAYRPSEIHLLCTSVKDIMGVNANRMLRVILLY